MAESDSGHTTVILGAAALGAIVATGIGYFIRKEDKSKMNRKIKKLQNEVDNLKKAVIQPDRLATLTQNLANQTHQAQNVLDSQVLGSQAGNDSESETF